VFSSTGKRNTPSRVKNSYLKTRVEVRRGEGFAGDGGFGVGHGRGCRWFTVGSNVRLEGLKCGLPYSVSLLFDTTDPRPGFPFSSSILSSSFVSVAGRCPCEPSRSPLPPLVPANASVSTSVWGRPSECQALVGGEPGKLRRRRRCVCAGGEFGMRFKELAGHSHA
jgi:hypothetical protein